MIIPVYGGTTYNATIAGLLAGQGYEYQIVVEDLFGNTKVVGVDE